MADDSLVDKLSGLRKQVRATERRTSLAPEGAGDKVFSYLDEQLRSYDLKGKVVTVLTRTDGGDVICYGQHIAADNLHRGLNMNIAARGPAVSSPPGTPSEEFVEHGPLAQGVCQREIQRLTSYKEGHLVPLRGPKDKYAALVNIDVNFDDPNVVAYPYPRRSD